MSDEKDLVKLRNKMNRKRKDFKRQESHKLKRLGTEWRKPRGQRSRLRRKMNGEKVVSIGYRGPKEVRGLHPSGKEEKLVHNPKELDELKDELVRIGSTVGRKKKLKIMKKAKKKKLDVINPPKEEKK